ncbi:metallophosphoesterase family protein [Methanotorris igneus]|uniref:DNA double-strand break repair protein Mre11 n=1 Tax=Methanotorris igneus (strain DSM 5666 / JCM 11834 / Kol 5) TaxID=880724 RepID=F6BAS5_METIK|nr:DNA repair exonuclease [Methanotorris igneus]AEF95889.1 metallophosphoesterase [Methanotorris igneus Kol 5]
MQFVHIGDNHLGYRQYNLDERENDIYNSFNECIEKILEIRPDFVVHSGDLFEDIRPPIKALSTAMRGFSRLKEKGIPIYIVMGNHDIPKRRFQETPLVLLKNYIRTFVNKPYHIHGDVFIGGANYHSKIGKENLIERLKILENASKEYRKKILIMHQGINPYVPEYELEKSELPEFSYYAMGHIHNRIIDRLENGGVLAYSGSTEIMRKDEYKDYKKNGKGFYVVDMSGDFDKNDVDFVKVESVNVKCRDFFEIFIDSKEKFEEFLNALSNTSKPIVHGVIKREFVMLLGILKSNALWYNIRIVDDEDIEYDIPEHSSIEKLFAEYVKSKGLDADFVLNLHRKLINNEGWEEFVKEYYNKFE